MTHPDDDREVPERPGPDDEELPEFEAPLEAEPADAFEQAQEVPGDDDEYRPA